MTEHIPSKALLHKLASRAMEPGPAQQDSLKDAKLVSLVLSYSESGQVGVKLESLLPDDFRATFVTGSIPILICLVPLGQEAGPRTSTVSDPCVCLVYDVD